MSLAWLFGWVWGASCSAGWFGWGSGWRLASASWFKRWRPRCPSDGSARRFRSTASPPARNPRIYAEYISLITDLLTGPRRLSGWLQRGSSDREATVRCHLARNRLPRYFLLRFLFLIGPLARARILTSRVRAPPHADAPGR